jgi:hypothetical protein
MTDFSEGGKRRYDTSVPASIRHNNPGAMYPAGWMKQYGMNGVDIIGGGHKIANFPNAVYGAAANFDLFSRGYVGKTLNDAIQKWSGGNSSGAYASHVAKQAGISGDTVISADMWRNPQFAPKMLGAMASWEKGPRGHQFQLSPEQWQQAHGMYLNGGGQAPALSMPTAPPQIAPSYDGQATRPHHDPAPTDQRGMGAPVPLDVTPAPAPQPATPQWSQDGSNQRITWGDQSTTTMGGGGHQPAGTWGEMPKSYAPPAPAQQPKSPDVFGKIKNAFSHCRSSG